MKHLKRRISECSCTFFACVQYNDSRLPVSSHGDSIAALLDPGLSLRLLSLVVISVVSQDLAEVRISSQCFSFV